MADTNAMLRAELAQLHREGLYVRVRLIRKADPTAYEELKEALTSVLLPSRGGARRSKAKARKPTERRRESADLVAEIEGQSFGAAFQAWYSKALRVVEQLLPDRYAEFRELHRLDRRPKELTPDTYTISDFTRGIEVRDVLGAPVFNAGHVAATKLQTQIDILDSAVARLDSALSDITGLVESGFIDDELGSARELARAKYLRASGVVAGVALERHLKRVVATHKVAFRKKPQIASLNDALKDAKIYGVPQWRRIQHLGDLRNLCGHDKEHEPTADDVEELISGVAKVTLNVF